MTAEPLTRTTIEPDGGTFQLLRRALGVSSFGMNALVMAPGERGRIHAHEHQEEVYLVLDGELTLLVDDGQTQERVQRWEAIRVPAATRRQLVNEGAAGLVVLALGGTGGHVHPGRDGVAWATWDDPGEGASPRDVPLPSR